VAARVARRAAEAEQAAVRAAAAIGAAAATAAAMAEVVMVVMRVASRAATTVVVMMGPGQRSPSAGWPRVSGPDATCADPEPFRLGVPKGDHQLFQALSQCTGPIAVKAHDSAFFTTSV